MDRAELATAGAHAELVTRLELKAFLERNPYVWETAVGFARKIGRSPAVVTKALADLERLEIVVARGRTQSRVYQLVAERGPS